jgi:hypothetical protein
MFLPAIVIEPVTVASAVAETVSAVLRIDVDLATSTVLS